MSVVIGPLLMTPLLFGLMGTFIGRMVERSKTESVRIGIVGSETAPQTMALLRENVPNTTFEPIPQEKAEQSIKERTYKAVVTLPENADAALQAEQSLPIGLMLDAGNQDSQMASGRIKAAMTAVGQTMLAERLTERNLPTDFAMPIKVTERPIESGGSRGMMMLTMMLPYILIISAFSGAIYAAFDQVAGEKERGTLETLLVSPASRRDIVLGKFAAVVGVCLISGLLTIIGMIIPFASGLKAYAWLSEGGLSLSPLSIGVALLVMLPLSILFAGLLLTVSTFARNQKEAQTYLFPLMTAILLPAMMSMFTGTDVEMSYAVVPVLNASIIIKQALSNSFDFAFIGVAFAASIGYAALALLVAMRLFQKESVLLKA